MRDLLVDIAFCLLHAFSLAIIVFTICVFIGA